MRTCLSKAVWGLAWVVLAADAGAAVQYVRFGKLIDGKGKVWTDVAVTVEGERILAVGPDREPPAGATVVDLRRYTGIPGMIDAHTHMTYYWDQAPDTRPWDQAGARAAAVTVFLAQENARKTLESGVTTVRDLGASDYADVAMRDLINRGAMVGPRMFVAGWGLSVTTSPLKPGVPALGGTADGVAVEHGAGRVERAGDFTCSDCVAILPFGGRILQSLNLKNPRAYLLASELSGLTGESLTSAVISALEASLEVERNKLGGPRKAEDILAFARRFSAGKSPNSRSEDHARDLYDENGMPA